MKLFKKIGLPALALLVGLSACAASTEGTVTSQQGLNAAGADSTKVISYICGPEQDEKLSVEYGFKGQEVVAAVVSFEDTVTKALARISGVDDGRTFYGGSGDFIWMTEAFDLGSVATAKGKMLIEEDFANEGFGRQPIHDMLIQDCVVKG